MNGSFVYDLTSASQVFSVANTPGFLARKLREEPVVQEIAADQSWSSEDLGRFLAESVKQEPQIPAEAVLPYVLLVVFSLRQSMDQLERAAGLSAPYHDWFQYLRGYLIQTLELTQHNRIDAPSALEHALPILSSEDSSQLIEVGEPAKVFIGEQR